MSKPPEAPSWLRPGGPLKRVRKGVIAVFVALFVAGVVHNPGSSVDAAVAEYLIWYAWVAVGVFYCILHVCDLFAVLFGDPTGV